MTSADGPEGFEQLAAPASFGHEEAHGRLAPARSGDSALADGQWHRLHPATPLLKGGFALLVILGFVVSNLRDRVIQLFTGNPEFAGQDPITEIYEHGLVGWALLAIAVVISLIVVAFYFSWRMHTFRVTDESVDVRSGILLRTHRQARLDRIQGINVVKPLVARIFGASKLEVTVAGQGANVQLSYLATRAADVLRRDILLRASGVRRERVQADSELTAAPLPLELAGDATEPHSILGDRLNEFLAPELDPDAAPPESVVRIPPGRLIGSLVLSGFTVFMLFALAAVIVGVVNDQFWVLFLLLPGVIASFSFYSSRFLKSLRYSVANTADGIRVGFGLLSTTSDTIPPGRIHAIEVRQPLLWRPSGWWEVRINRAGHSSVKGAAGQGNTTILPVGDFADVQRILALLVPTFTGEEAVGLVTAGATSRGGDGLFVDAPNRAAWLRPFSWRRTGYAIHGGAVVLRRGVVWRELILVPLARIQSLGLQQGPVRRALRLSIAELHTVQGPVSAVLGVIDTAEALTFFERIASAAVYEAGVDTSEHWARGDDESH
ncbi:PH domain-containing protein [Homoserinimonas sp. OAct 916]|uniref:PH domain-containing protein n=1 Tax=Homoserinimonas sp. OAct 916 TaxID=2211450 RepID=UPI000DBEA015|nr:PH domain-containing protein [Homoserinimonas sp. OAct 916]